MRRVRGTGRAWWWAALLAVALAAAACSGDASTPTPTATATPTPVPRIDVSQTTTVRDVVLLLPQADAECIQLDFIAEDYSGFLDGEFSFDQSAFPERSADCFSNESLVLLFVGGLEHEAGGLSEQSVVCLRETLGAVDLVGLSQTADTEAGLGAAIGLLLCLTDEEAERISISRFLGDQAASLGALSLRDLRCVVERSDLQAVGAAIEDLLAGGLPDADMLAVLAACSSAR